MLKLLLGRAGTGKTTRLMAAVREDGPRRPQIILVPEQVSHDRERLLCQACGPSASRWAEVLSFTRLASRVFHEAGGSAGPVLDAGGRLLLMSQAVALVSGGLRVYARPSRKAAFLEQLLATGDELKSYCVRPEDLLDAAREEQGLQSDRLHDLGLILSGYEALVARRAEDPRDRLTRLADTLRTCCWFRGKDVYLDCFTDFTPQQRQILAHALRQARRVTVALTCDSLTETGETVFQPARRTAQALVALCREEGIGMECEVLAGSRTNVLPELRHLEAHLFSDGAPAPEEAAGPCLFAAASPYEEAEWAARQILTLVRERDWHFRDITVAARTLERYQPVLESVFRRYQIPLFLGRMEDILEKPVLTLLTAALESVRSHYETDDLFRYLKTGLAGPTWEEIDLLENYALRWDIRGSRWIRQSDWNWHPEGYSMPWREEDRALVARLDALRRRVIAPLEQLSQARRGTGAELARALYRFLEEIALPERLTERAEALRAAGELQQAEEYRQLWQVLIGALEQCSDLLSEQVLELDYFTDLFRLVLSQYSVGAIPVALDRVNGGDVARVAHVRCKALFLLGADDSQFPLVSESPGLLTDRDRALLAGHGLELAPSAGQRLDREQALAYGALTRPTELLYLSYPQAVDGAAQRPAVLWERLERMFPRAPRGALEESARLLAPLPALELAAETGDESLLERLAASPERTEAVRRVRSARSFTRGRLSPETVHALYGQETALSASRMDKLKSCHFSYFLQYGLKAKARRPAGFDAPEVGTFVHYVLEHVLRAAQARGGVAALAEEERRSLSEQAVRSYIETQLGALDEQTPRFRYLFGRMRQSVELIVSNVVEELEHSQFIPLSFELGFGRGEDLPPVRVEVGDLTLFVSGFVDRVDGWEKDGRLYLRVVDYKTGRKSFSLTDVWHGLSLQMLLYLFTLQEQGETYYGRPVLPAGVLYLPARDVLLPGSREMDEPSRLRAADKALRRSGLLLRDEEVLRAMEPWDEGGPRFLPVRVSRAGAISGDSLATAEQWGILHRRLHDLLREMGQELAAGDIDADPYWKGSGHTACDFCDFAQACHFEEGRGGDRRRFLYSVSGKEFWEGGSGDGR